MPVVSFSARELQILKTIVRSHRHGRQDDKPTSKAVGSAIETKICKLDEQIAGTVASTSGDLAGAGTVSLFKIQNGNLVDTNRNITAYNISTGSIPSGLYASLTRDPQSGQYIIANGSVSDCETEDNEVWTIYPIGQITGGSFTIGFAVDDTTGEIEIDYDDAANDVKTAFATHASLSSTDLIVGGGPLPMNSLIVTFSQTATNSGIGPPIVGTTGLTGQLKGVVISRWNVGFSCTPPAT